MRDAISYVYNEHKNNLDMIIKLAITNMSKQTIRTTLGVWWVYIHDILYFSVFILFRILMAGNGHIEGMHSVVYLITGLVPWFFMNEVLNTGSNAIKVNKGIIQSIKFPTSVLPTIEVLAIFFKRIFTFILVFVVEIYYGYIGEFNLILFVYYVICMFILMWAINLSICALVAVSGDFNQIYLAITRVLMFSLPIIWSFENIMDYKVLSILLRFNPMVYIIHGFRNAFVLGQAPDCLYTIYFWLCTAILTSCGCLVQYKLRKYYADFV